MRIKKELIIIQNLVRSSETPPAAPKLTLDVKIGKFLLGFLPTEISQVSAFPVIGIMGLKNGNSTRN